MIRIQKNIAEVFRNHHMFFLNDFCAKRIAWEVDKIPKNTEIWNHQEAVPNCEPVMVLERMYESEFSRNVGKFFLSVKENGYTSDFFDSIEEAEGFARQEFDIR